MSILFVAMQIVGTFLLSLEALRLKRFIRLRNYFINLSNTGDLKLFDKEGKIVDHASYFFLFLLLTFTYVSVIYVTLVTIPKKALELFDNFTLSVQIIFDLVIFFSIVFWVLMCWLLSIYYIALLAPPILSYLINSSRKGTAAIWGLLLIVLGLVFTQLTP